MEYMSPNSSLDFKHNVSDFLADGETASSATWTLESGLTGSGQFNDSTSSTLQVATGDVAGKVCQVIVEIDTNAGNTFRRQWFITVQEQLA